MSEALLKVLAKNMGGKNGDSKPGDAVGGLLAKFGIDPAAIQAQATAALDALALRLNAIDERQERIESQLNEIRKSLTVLAEAAQQKGNEDGKR